jgi:hypothetical protein
MFPWPSFAIEKSLREITDMMVLQKNKDGKPISVIGAPHSGSPGEPSGSERQRTKAGC